VGGVNKKQPFELNCIRNYFTGIDSVIAALQEAKVNCFHSFQRLVSAGRLIHKSVHTNCALLGPDLDQAFLNAGDHALVSVEEQIRQEEA
jgi:hypothetical protein